MSGTGGGRNVTGGGRFRLDTRDRIGLGIAAVLTLMIAVVNAFTVGHDFAENGEQLDTWEPWVWEMTSAAFWVLAAVPLLRLLGHLRPPRLGWPAAAFAVVLVSIPASAAHVAFMAVSRSSVYALLGSAYSFDFAPTELVYEWRKDLLSVIVFAVIGYLVDRLAHAEPVPVDDKVPFRLEVRDGGHTRWFAATDIERVEAAGNYVELHTSTGPVLHRATLAAVADLLAPHGFARIHRSRLVRRDAVIAVVTTASGDFEARLASGTAVAGSRRFRKGLAG